MRVFPALVHVGKHGRLWGEQKMISQLCDATHRSGAWSAQPFGSRPGLNGLAASDLNPLEPACWRTGFNIHHHRGWAAVPLSSSTITVAGLTHSPASRLLQVILRQMHDRRDATILGSCQTHYLPHTPTRRSRLAGEPRRDCARAVGVWRAPTRSQSNQDAMAGAESVAAPLAV